LLENEVHKILLENIKKDRTLSTIDLQKRSVWELLVPLDDEEPTHSLFGFSEPLSPIDLLEVISKAIFNVFVGEEKQIANALTEEIKNSLDDNDIDPLNQMQTREFLLDIVLNIVENEGAYALMMHLNSTKQLPAKLDQNVIRVSFTKLDRAFERFLKHLPENFHDEAYNSKGDLYSIIYDETGRQRGKINQVVKKEIGGRLLSALIISSVAHNIEENLDQGNMFEDPEDVLNHLKNVGSLERFLPRINHTSNIDMTNEDDRDYVRVGILQLFEDAIERSLSFKENSMLKQMLLATLHNAVKDFNFQVDFDTDTNLDIFVNMIVDKFESVGNEIFLEEYKSGF
jgi:hypothetical protein